MVYTNGLKPGFLKISKRAFKVGWEKRREKKQRAEVGSLVGGGKASDGVMDEVSAWRAAWDVTSLS